MTEPNAVNDPAAAVRIREIIGYLLPVPMRVPLKFGTETIDRVTCFRARVVVEDAAGQSAVGWGETPLSVTWAWPSPDLSIDHRYRAMVDGARRMADRLVRSSPPGHAMDIGHDLIDTIVRDEVDRGRLPHLAALIVASALDIAVHDAHANAAGVDVYDLYRRDRLPGDLSRFFGDESERWTGIFLEDFLDFDPPVRMPVWHLVGGLDPIDSGDLDSSAVLPDDGHPVTLRDWIRRDRLTHLKIKLRGNDSSWDDDRVRRVATVASEEIGRNRFWLSTDFNCTVTDPAYVNDLLDRWRQDCPEWFERIRYVEQPFPHDLDAHRINVSSVARRRDLFLDESAHDWRLVRLGRSLGWNGVALKTCKSQTGALLSMAWAKRAGMPLMVQDLTNPMLAQIPHVRLAAHVGTIAGVESNAMQFYPDASLPESAVHPGLYRRRDGELDASTLGATGFGYRIDEIERELPPPAVRAEA